jgi:hypothetical protein
LATFTDPGGPEYFVPQLSISTTSNSFGALAAGTYYYTLTSITASGESTASNGVSATTTGGTSVVQLNWNQVTGATGYKIYRGTSPGAEDTLIATLSSGSNLQFLDEGSEATSHASPPTNTSADHPLSDPNPYVATIQWGDGNSSTATLANGGIILGSDGQTFSVNLAHLYADEGAYNITVTLNHNGVQSAPVTIAANVAESDNLTATGVVSITTTAGTPLVNATLATFTDTYTGNTASDFGAIINWGDGQSSNGTVSGSNGNFTVTGSHTYAAAGNYTIGVAISDDGAGTATAMARDTVTLTSLNQSVVKGLTAGIGFWQNKNGQALIDSFNGGSTSTALSHWLATTFPNLYGGLAGDTNTQVAAYFLTLFDQHGPKAQAQTLAVALNVDATTLSLGGNAGAAYGVTVSAAGLGAYSYNVGSDGAAFGVANNTTLNVYQLLLAVNKKFMNGVVYDGSQVADLFGNLNQAGKIG